MKPSEYIAAVDLGSNSFHMIVARVDKTGTISIVDKLRETVRLGNGIDEHGNLREDAVQRGLECLERFSQRIRSFPEGAVRIVGTNTLRLAKNSAAFLQAANDIMQHPIEIIAGREEARIIYLGVAYGRASEGRRLVVDIGGGSTEFIIGEEMQPSLRESVQAGCVSFTRMFFADGMVTEERMKKAIIKAKLAFHPIAYKFWSDNWDEAIGCSGTIKAIRNIAHAEEWCQQGIERKALYKMRDALIEAGDVRNLKLKLLDDGRAEVLPAGLAVLIAVFETLNVERMKVSEQALREGLIYDIIGRIRHEDVRFSTVKSVAGRWGVDERQAELVRDTATLLFDQVSDNWELGEDERDMLSWAASLHEIGLHVSHSGYHSHGAYILANADLPGFSRPEQATLAALVKNQRRKFMVVDFDVLPSKKLSKRLCILLRLAVLLHRSRVPEKISAVNITAKGKQVNLTIDAQWLDAHSLIYFDLQTEQQWLEDAGYGLEVVAG
jgi:exopolyphosphatase / guanosine-5'-triphosphate,3'-diphosphate pyrophosphatase